MTFGQSSQKHEGKYGKASKDSFGDTTTVFSWNINGLNAVLNKGKLIEFLTNFDPDVVCFNETKTDYDKMKNFSK